MRLLSLLLACAPGAPDAGDATDPATSTTPTTPWEPGAPGLDAGAVQAELQTALDIGLPDAPGVLWWLDWAMDQGDFNCPRRVGDYGLGESMAGCIASTGWFYSGLVFHEQVEGGWELTGDGEMRDPTGNPFLAVGYFRAYGGGTEWELRLGGQWGYRPAAVGWVGALPDLAMEIVAHDDGRVELVGGYAPDGHDVYFDDVVVGPDGVSGALRARDPDGGWYRVPLDPDGCGEVDWYGTGLGPACVDLQAPIADLRARMEAG